MFRPYEYGCARYKPTLRLVCVVISTLLLFAECYLSAYDYIVFRETGNPVSAVLSGTFALHGILTLLYILGAVRGIGSFMMPWLTAQLIFVTNLPYFRHPSLSNGEFFVLAGSFLTLLFAATAKLSILLYKGYVDVEAQKFVHLRISEAVERKISFPYPKPTYV
ncbi:unnamed protein product [Caenorhabditis auriculariae]|uniref:Uncharacterized protein n=1 Tax=Caenorhabditis auriculariae TaxID=2777116 RepID=A0A8S1HFT6_9PELO|nr:unnamed protein product [Caenorhabditis auriculariae]